MTFTYQPKTFAEFYPVIYVYINNNKYSSYRLDFHKNKWHKKKCQWCSNDEKFPNALEAFGRLLLQLNTDKGKKYKNPDTVNYLLTSYPEYLI